MDAMLNTAITQQLEGVKRGILNLHESLDSIQEVKSDYFGFEECLAEVPGLVGKLHEIQEENKKHLQLRTAMKNIKSIIEMPDTISESYKSIEDGSLFMVRKLFSPFLECRIVNHSYTLNKRLTRKLLRWR